MENLLISLIICIPAAIGAFILENRRRNREVEIDLSDLGETFQFTWGYYMGMQFIVLGLIGLIFSISDLIFELTKVTQFGDVIILVIGAIYSALGYYTIKRKKIAWIAMTVLTLNPVCWIVNWNYGKNRWGWKHFT